MGGTEAVIGDSIMASGDRPRRPREKGRRQSGPPLADPEGRRVG